MPIGIQTFADIITDGYVYVDKTAWVHRLANEGKFFFLGRPRRFGKSLLVSTLRAYFEGKKELFRGLAIEGLERDWTPYPVFHIDLTVTSYRNADDLEKGLDANLRSLEETWGKDPQDTTAAMRFRGLIRRAAEKSGRKVVVLIDEYDRPLTQALENGGDQDAMRNALKGFYGVLKSADEWLRFVLLTGVTKFSKVSVFSDLNMLRDISMENTYTGICGISARELEDTFGSELSELAENTGMTYDGAVAEMKKRYDGYRFSKQSEGMFNPFSVLNTFAKQEFAYYWFETGTPTFLIELLKKENFNPLEFAEGITISAESINDYRAEGGNPVPLLYQSGYLTITGYDRGLDEYTLGFPNGEVKYGFLKKLLPYYIHGVPKGEFFAGSFIRDLRDGDVDGFMERMRAFFANIPYELNIEAEKHYQFAFYAVFTLLGQYARAEVHSAIGRADVVVETADTVYVFEFKLNGTAEEALAQIDDRGYAVSYSAGKRRVVKIGAAFDRETRNIVRWLVN